MKKVLAVLGGIIVLAAAFLAFMLFVKKPAQRPALAVQVKSTPELVARGKYLVEHVSNCVDCHSQADHSKFGNPIVAGREGVGGECWTPTMHFPGTLCALNLTPDKDTGLGNWTDGEIIRAFREGVDKNGKALFNLMPYDLFASMSDHDAEAVVAYLRTLPAVRNEVPARKLDFPLPIIVKLMPKPLTGPVPEPDHANSVAYGKYLATIGGCHFCHTPADAHEQNLPGKDFAGGHHFWNPAGGEVVTPNLTSDPTGVTGRLSKAQFVALFKAYDNAESQNIAVDPKQNTVMPWLFLSGMTPEDLGAIYDYLRSVPPQKNVVQAFPRPAGATSAQKDAP
jgi:mono/diheme cytochrome c family protein